MVQKRTMPMPEDRPVIATRPTCGPWSRRALARDNALGERTIMSSDAYLVRRPAKTSRSLLSFALLPLTKYGRTSPGMFDLSVLRYAGFRPPRSEMLVA